MSQPKLTLRPPPNVDFVQGYPGIPPGGTERPQAAVKGAIEVRVGQQGVKAKWVRIELRKIETLPGGGVANTFFDFVGQSPINLWQSPNDEYTTLHTNDFPFFIRIPESIPPTIALEKGAGIKYELIASVCVQGKRGFLRRDKPVVTASASTIIIDKHELHSTWPIYSQPESRSLSQDGVTLIIERSHTCYGPGDRVVVMATVKSDTLHTVMLRGFEFMLRETTIFRAAPHTQGKKGSPQVKVSSIGEQKVPVNATLYGGTQHKAELSVTVPPHHTSATINAARHIDINYVLTVKALLNTGQPIIMDLPIMISNWPRAVSVEAMRRIGHAFNVSLPAQAGNARAAQTPPAQQDRFAPASSVSPSVHSQSYTASTDQKSPDFRTPSKPYNTVPANADRSTAYGATNEFGQKNDISAPSYPAQTIGATGPTRTRAESGSSVDYSGARPRSSNGRVSNPAARLTIVNASEEEVKEQLEAEQRNRRQPSTILESPLSTTPPPLQPSPSPKITSTPSRKDRQWMTSEQEKELLYNRAKDQVERAQNAPQNGSADTPAVVSPAPVTSSSKPERKWPSAEEEKARLFQEAQKAVARARGQEASEGSSQSQSRLAESSSYSNVQGNSSASGSGRTPSVSAGAALYKEAMSQINKPTSSGASPSARSPVTPASALPSAADEKAMLERYYAAKKAVHETQSAYHGRVPGNAEATPVPYDALYPGQRPPSAGRSNSSPVPAVQSPPADMPPSFAAASGSSSHPILSEKERLRRHFEAQDAAAVQQQQQPWQPSPPPAQYPTSQPPHAYPLSAPAGPTPLSAGSPPPFASPSMPLSAFEEKEMLRRRYEREDSTTPPRRGSTPTATPPLRASQIPNGVGGRGRPPPTPPGSGMPPSNRPLTAVEEKARLQALYEADDRGAGAVRPPAFAQSPYPSPPPSNGYHDHDSVFRTTPAPPHIMAPPPLAPKPPKEYIEETQAVDRRTTAKLQAIDGAGVLAAIRQTDPDLASIAPSEPEEHDDDLAAMDAADNTFGPGTLSGLASGSSALPPSRKPSVSPSVLSVPPPPPLPPKLV